MAEESDSLNLDFEREIHRFEAPADGEQAPAPPPHVERRITPSPDVPAEHDPEACEAIEDAVHTAQYILQDLGDTRPLAGARGLIRALSAAEAPHAHLRDLLYLARSRVRAHQMRGGTIHNKAAYYVRTAQQLLLEARRASWDLDALGAAG